MSEIKDILTQQFGNAIEKAFGKTYADTDPLISVATNPDFGDYQVNVAMSLAKKMGSRPRELADELVNKLEISDICKKIDIAGPGFINLSLQDSFINTQLALMARHENLGIKKSLVPEKVVVDYSAPNVAKEMHVGHLRSTVIGDAIVRVLQVLGHTVIRQNHMGDWGTQFGMLIEYLLDSGWSEKDDQQSISDIEERYRAAKQKFDADDGFKIRARERVVSLQSGDKATLEMWKYLVDESKQHFNQVYSQLNVLLEEQDIRAESFYNSALANIIAKLDHSGLLEESEGAMVVFPDGFRDRDDKPLPMIVQKSDGGYLYATTDLAALEFRLNELAAKRIIYVTDARQSQHFAMLFAVADKAKWTSDAIRLDHVAFGTVLGSDRKPFKTRDGGTIKLVDLIDEAKSRALKVIAEKNPTLEEEERENIANKIAIAALKYADLSSDRIKDYVFDWDRMLALDGNTAPYLENAYVRILSIFRKGQINLQELDAGHICVNDKAEKNLALKIFQYPDVVSIVGDRLEPHRLCTYLYELAASFHSFYELCPILKEGVEVNTKASRLALCQLCARILEHGMSLLGIETVEQM